MAKRNQVTTDLRIKSEAQLQNGRSFIKQLDKVIEKLTFGDKIDNQLVNAKKQVIEYSKILEKVHNKSLVSDEELKNITKAGKEIANIISKTQQYYINLDSNQLQKFSREYINQMKAREEAVAKIKNDYAARTGKNFDKELANYDKLSAKIKALEQEKTNLTKNGTTQIVTREIEQLNQKLEEQKNKLLEIKKVQADSSKAYSSTLDKESKKRGHNSFDDLKGVRGQSEEQIRKQLGNAEYKQQSNILTEINRQIKEIEKNKQEGNQADRAAIALAKKYKIENISTLQDLKEQVRLKKENLNQFKNNKSDLANEKLVTAEFQRQNKILADREAVINAAKKAELTVIQKNSPYNSKASLTAGASATNRSIASLENQLTDSGIEQITNNATTVVTNELTRIETEITKTNQSLNEISGISKQIATLTNSKNNTEEGTSEKIEDLDKSSKETKKIITGVKTSSNSILKNTSENGTINKYTNKDNTRIQDYLSKKEPIMLKEAKKAMDLIKQSSEFGQVVGDGPVNSSRWTELRRTITQAEELLQDKEIGIITDAQLERLDRYEKKIKDIFLLYRQRIGKKLNKYNTPEAKQNDDMIIEGSQYLNAIKPGKDAMRRYEKYYNYKNLSSKKTKPSSSKGDKGENFKNIAKDAEEASTGIAKAVEQSRFLSSTFDDFKNKIAYFLSLNYIFDQMTRKITEAVDITKEMDKDMTQIGLVLGKTSGQVWKNFDTYSSMADRLNTTTSEVTQSMKLFYQQGLNTAEVNKMVEASAIAAALGESTMAEASETLTSIINSYNLSANEALIVTDKISQIAIVSAADFGELSTAIEKVASSAASAGLDLDHMMGYLAKMIETTREAPTNIGTALKTIVANFTQFKEDPSGLNQEGSEINKVDKALKSVGISLTDTQGEVRDLSEVLDELGGKWETLTRSQKSYLATQIAGTRQQSRFYALMNDYDRTLELVAEGSNSSGKAQQQFALYSNSLEASTKKLNNEWERFFNQITQGNGLLKNFNSLLTFLMKIVNDIGPIGTVLGLSNFIRLMRKGITIVEDFSSDTEKLVDNEETIKNLKKPSKRLRNIDGGYIRDKTGKKVKNSNYKNDKIKYEEEVLNIAKENKVSKSNVKIASYQKETNKINNDLKTMKGITNKVKANGEKLWISMKQKTLQATQAVKIYAKQLAIMSVEMIAMWAIGKVFEGISKAIDSAVETVEELGEKAEKANENASTVQGLRDEYEKLAKTVNRTAKENERMKEITKEVAEVSKELGTTLRDNVDAFQDNIKQMDAYIKRQNEIAGINMRKAAEEQLKDDGNWWNSFWRNIGETSGGQEAANNNIKSVQQHYTSISEGTSLENNFTEEQKKIFNSYVEQWIQEKEQSWKTSEEWYKGTEEFKTAVKNFALKIDSMTPKQQEEYNDLYKDINDQSLSYSQLKGNISQANLDETLKNTMLQEVELGKENNRQAIKDNTLLTDADIDSFIDELPRDVIKQIFNPTNFDTLSKNEQNQYWSAVSSIFKDGNLKEGLINAVEKEGREGLTTFVKQLQDTNFAYKEIIEDVTGGVITLTNKVEEAKTAFEKLKTIMQDPAWTGQYSQLDLIEGIINDKYNIQDIHMVGEGEGAFASINFDTLIADWTAQFAKIEGPFKSQRDAAQARINTYSNYGNSLVDQAQTAVNTQNDNIKMAQQEQQDAIKQLATAANNLDSATKELDEAKSEDTEKVLGGGAAGMASGAAIGAAVGSIAPVIGTAVGATVGSMIGTVVGVGIGSAASSSKITGAENNVKSNQEQVDIAQTRVDSANQNLEEQNKLLDEQQKKLELANHQKELLESHEDRLIVLARERLGAEASDEQINKQVDALKQEKNSLEEVANGEKRLAEEAKEANDTALTAIEKIKQKSLYLVQDYKAVFETFAQAGQLDTQLDGIAEAYGLLEAGAEGYFEVSQAIANDPSLIEAIDMESEYLEFDKQKLEEVAAAKVQAQITDLQSRLEGTKAIIGLIESEINARNTSVTQEEVNLDDKADIISSAMAYQDSLTENQQNSTDTEKENLEVSINNWQEWEKAVIEAVQAVENARAGLAQGIATNSTEAKTFETKLGKYSLSGSKEGKETESADSKKEKYKTDLNDLKTKIKSSSNEDLQKMLENYTNQKTILEKSIASLNKYKANIGKNLDKRAGGGKGGKDAEKELDSLLEKLDHFYNYLRKIEKLEAKLMELSEKRNLIDANNNYYIDDLKEENELLNEQQKLYTNYIKDEEDYLAGLRNQLKNDSEYGSKVYFDKDGLIQVNQTEFTAETEEEQERLKTFLELVQLYQDEYNTKLENQNKLIQSQVQQLENVKKMYDKVLQRISDVAEEIERQIGLTEHNQTMEFSEIEQIDLSFFKAGQNVEGIQYTSKEIAKLNKEIASINKTVKDLPYSELLEWDEELQQWDVNEEKMKDPAIKKKYEEMGYTWSDIETSVRSITTQSQSLNKSLKKTVEKSNSFRENLKQILDDVISGITDFFSRSTDMINQYFHQIERGMDDIDNQNDLFGVNSESLENKYKTLVQSVVIMKQLNTALQEERKKTEKELTKSYGAYVTFVNGVAVMNEQAVDNSTKLTEEQKAELKTLIAAYNSATDQIEGLEDKQLEYFQKMMEMEEAKRDAIIELKQQVHDELLARDQEEIDNLRSKYEKMNQLDQEYYSELQQRVSDARDLRDRRQESNNIGQMQARLAVLKADNSGTYNSELIELQKQLNQALQTQADNDVNRELERIQREQKQREEDRALTISAMENVLTFKDENNWYWQEADRIWREGQQSVAGFLMTSNEYLNISNEQRAQQFGALTDNMNTAFTNLSQKAGETMSVSTGIVKNATDAVKSSIDYVQGQLGSGENGVIYSSITSNGDKISEGTTSITGAVSATPGDFQAKMRDLYNSQIGKDVQSGAKAVEKYLGKDSTLLTKTNSIIDQINTVDGKIKDKIGTTNTFLSTGFSNLHDALLGQNNSVSANIKSYLDTYLGQNSTIWKYLSKKYADEYGKKETQNTKPTTTPNAAKPNNNNQSKNDNNTPKPGGGNGTPEVGDVVTYIGGTYYSSSDGGTPVGKRGPGKKVTITRIVPNAAYPIHVKSSDSAYGWLKKSQISGYRKGGYVDYTGVAEVHGSRKDPEAFLNVKQTRLFEELRDSLVRKNVNGVYDKDPVEISKEEYNIDKINIEVKQIADVDAVEKVTKKVKEEIYKDAVGNNNMAVRRR